MYRLGGVLILIIILLAMIEYTDFKHDSTEGSTIAMGFLIISAFLIGQFLFCRMVLISSLTNIRFLRHCLIRDYLEYPGILVMVQGLI